MNKRSTLLAGATALVAAVLSSSPALAAVVVPAPAGATAAGVVASPSGVAIADHYRQLGGSRSVLGAPVGRPVPVGRGAVQAYANGKIFWSPATGAWEVHGAVLDRYLLTGGPTGPLGFPRTDERGTPDRVGRFNHFSTGSVYWTPATGAHAVRGAIRDRWAAMGWETGAIGYPTSEEVDTADGRGRVSTFAGRDGAASIYWKSGIGARAVYGAIRKAYEDFGGVRSPLGFPTTDEYATESGRRGDFAGGAVLFDSRVRRPSVVLPAAAPDALTATPGDGRAELRFARAADPNRPVTGYEVSVDAGPWLPLPTTPGEGQTLVAELTSLSNGSQHTARVRALNLLGAGPAATATVTPVPSTTAPGMIMDLVAVPSDSAAQLTFTAPADGGSEITGWEYAVDGGDWAPLQASVVGPLRTATIGMLTNGRPYTFQVRAVNALGSGPAAPVSVTPLTVPDVVGDLSATAANGAFSLQFGAPGDGGGALTGYEYRLDGGDWLPLVAQDLGEGRNSWTLADLLDGQTYSLEVRALNAAGPGPASAVLTVTPRGVPGAITDLVAGERMSVGARVLYTPPSLGGSPMTELEYSLDGGQNWQQAPGYDPGPQWGTTFWGLTNGTSYTFQIRFVNEIGPGPASNPVTITPMGLPGAVSGLTTSLASEVAALTFPEPDDGGSSTVSYEYRVGSGDWAPLTVEDGSSGTLVSTLPWALGLTGAVQVRAVNEIGAGTASGAVGVGQQAPGRITGLTAVDTFLDTFLDFPVPAAGSSPITGYEYSMDGGAFQSLYGSTGNNDGIFHGYVFSGLWMQNNSHSYRVRAVSADGVGEASDPAYANGWG